MSQPPRKDKQPTRHLFGTDGVRGVANQEPMTSGLSIVLTSGPNQYDIKLQ